MLYDVHDAVGELLALLGTIDDHEVLHVLGEHGLIVCGHRYDVVEREVAQHARLDLQLLGEGLPFHLVAGLELVLLHHTHRLEHLDALRVEVAVEDDRCRLLGVEAALGGFLNPLVAVAVAVEMDWGAGLDVVLHHREDGCELVLALCDECVDALLEACQGLGHGSVEHDLRAGAVGRRAHGAELEAVARECEWRGAVAVGVVAHDVWNFGYVDLHALLALYDQGVLVGVHDVVEHARHRLAKE